MNKSEAKLGDLLYIKPHKIVNFDETATYESTFATHLGRVIKIDEYGDNILLYCGPDMYNYDIWINACYLRPATKEEEEAWNGPYVPREA